ncbi:hypothetical protein [uncultured Clostridium sp.]|uniref:hypothetical protein n=1 Tax=uncultured Clostridium sp. TaxID=59620 RepID=UPI0026074B32|nr:hypothetical protein [uncultured Clostridium sp.]
MVDLSNFIDFTFIKLKRLDVNQGVSILTFKKDRKVSVMKRENCYDVIEDGFFKETFTNLDDKEVRKLLKSMVKKEFPRSNRLHLSIIEGDL